MALLQALLKTLANIARKILQALLAVIRFILWLLKKIFIDLIWDTTIDFFFN